MERGDDELELSLGLSLNGRFGVDPSRKKLRRSSSISNLPDTGGSSGNGSNNQAPGAAFEWHAPLARTCSLPTETEETRRRKEVQERFVEARKRMMEKMKTNVKDEVYESGIIMPSSMRLNIGSKSQTSRYYEEARQMRPSGPQLQEPMLHNPATRTGERDLRDENERLRNALLDMPLVSTTGDGPKIEGFLYRYNVGEPVKIVCVCHGYFLTPTEFYKHGGGGDVDNPLKHITVTPFFIA